MSSNRPDRLPLMFSVASVGPLPAARMSAQVPDAKTIIERSVQVNENDFEAAPEYKNKGRDRTPKGSKLYQVTVIDGTPHQRLLAGNGKPLPRAQEAQAMKNQQKAERERQAESTDAIASPDCRALPGMQGELGIDKKTFQWVKVSAQVIHPNSIEGFLTQVDPGTRFELEKILVGNNIWLPSHFAMKSHAKVLFLVNHSSSEDDAAILFTKCEHLRQI